MPVLAETEERVNRGPPEKWELESEMMPWNTDVPVADERDEIRQRVITMLRKYFIADEVARREKITVTARDLQARISRIAASQGMDPGQLHQQLEKLEMIPQIRQDILDQKIRTFLRERADIEEVDAD